MQRDSFNVDEGWPDADSIATPAPEPAYQASGALALAPKPPPPATPSEPSIYETGETLTDPMHSKLRSRPAMPIASRAPVPAIESEPAPVETVILSESNPPPTSVRRIQKSRARTTLPTKIALVAAGASGVLVIAMVAERAMRHQAPPASMTAAPAVIAALPVRPSEPEVKAPVVLRATIAEAPIAGVPPPAPTISPAPAKAKVTAPPVPPKAPMLKKAPEKTPAPAPRKAPPAAATNKAVKAPPRHP